MNKHVIAVISFVSLTTTAWAQEPYYVGLSYHAFEAEESTPQRDNQSAIRGEFGARINPNLALEAHYGVGLHSEDSITPEIAFDDYTAVYFKPELPLSDVIRAYGLIGYADVEKNHAKEYGPSYGFGGEIEVQPNVSLNIEFLQLLDEPLLNSSSLGVGFKLGW